MDRKTLMKSINYSRRILLTVSLLISQPCTFTTHLLTLQMQRSNISPASLCFCSIYGEDIKNVINFLSLVFQICCNTSLCIYSVNPDLMCSAGSGNAAVWICVCSVSHLFRVYFSTGGEIKQKCKRRSAAQGQRSWVLLVGLDLNTTSGSQGDFALLYVCLNVFYLLHYMYPIMQFEK